MRKIILASALAISLHPVAEAATTPAPGYIYTRDVLSQLTEGCVAPARGGDFVGVGPLLAYPPPGGTRSILFVSATGDVRTVATGLNSIGDCVYDAAADVLYVTDSGKEFAGATTGDTVFAIAGSSSDVPVVGLEVVPSGSIPYAFSIDLLGSELLVSNAAGSGSGDVVAIDLSAVTPTMSTFASGFDYTGGIAVDGTRVLVSQALQPAFTNAIYSYSTAGALQSTIAGPGFDQGSSDLAIAADGGILASGSPTLVTISDAGVATPLVTGLDGGTGYDAFGGGISVHPVTGRIDFLASSFSGADDDSSLHSLVPVDHLFAGGGNATSDCAMEFYGVDVPNQPNGRPGHSATCVDGSACDADGKSDGVCTFPIGLCFNVNDARLDSCTPSSVASVELLRSRPVSAGLASLVEAATALLPISVSTCVFGDGLRVPVTASGGGAAHPGRGYVRMRTVTGDAKPRNDSDIVRLVCDPAP